MTESLKYVSSRPKESFMQFDAHHAMCRGARDSLIVINDQSRGLTRIKVTANWDRRVQYTFAKRHI